LLRAPTGGLFFSSLTRSPDNAQYVNYILDKAVRIPVLTVGTTGV